MSEKRLEIGDVSKVELLRPEDIEIAVTTPMEEGPHQTRFASVRLTGRPETTVHLSPELVKFVVLWSVTNLPEAII